MYLCSGSLLDFGILDVKVKNLETANKTESIWSLSAKFQKSFLSQCSITVSTYESINHCCQVKVLWFKTLKSTKKPKCLDNKLIKYQMTLFQFNRSSPARRRRFAATSLPHAKRRRSRALPARGGSGRWRHAAQPRRRPSRSGGTDHHQPAADSQARRVRPGVEGGPGRRESHQRLFCQVPQGEALKKKKVEKKEEKKTLSCVFGFGLSGLVWDDFN